MRFTIGNKDLVSVLEFRLIHKLVEGKNDGLLF